MKVRTIGPLIGCVGNVMNPPAGLVLDVSPLVRAALVAAGLAVDDQGEAGAAVEAPDVEQATMTPPERRGPGRPRKSGSR